MLLWTLGSKKLQKMVEGDYESNLKKSLSIKNVSQLSFYMLTCRHWHWTKSTHLLVLGEKLTDLHFCPYHDLKLDSNSLNNFPTLQCNMLSMYLHPMRLCHWLLRFESAIVFFFIFSFYHKYKFLLKDLSNKALLCWFLRLVFVIINCTFKKCESENFPAFVWYQLDCFHLDWIEMLAFWKFE